MGRLSYHDEGAVLAHVCGGVCVRYAGMRVEAETLGTGRCARRRSNSEQEAETESASVLAMKAEAAAGMGSMGSADGSRVLATEGSNGVLRAACVGAFFLCYAHARFSAIGAEPD